jgi:isochorismate pyruvate lyase
MNYQNTIEPSDCGTMNDIRTEIDGMDHAIIAILGKRFEYVKAAAKFKTSATDVRASDRFATMLEKRREWAVAQGLCPDAIEKMYCDLVNHFISEEMSKWEGDA